MAKSRRARRAQREETKIQVHSPLQPAPAAPAAAVETESARREIFDFGQEYYYVFTELRTVTIVAAVMFALMFGLGYFI